MITFSLSSLSLAIAAFYISGKINDDVFKAAIFFTAVGFILLNLILAPWLLKIVGIIVFFLFSSLNSWSVKNFRL
ncbi:MAG: hypothetical protein AB4372_36710 [Xenococcus sp. (in: cyanobacteria)]